VASGREVWDLPEAGIDKFGFALSPDGKLAFTGGGSYMVGAGRAMRLTLWDLERRKMFRALDDSPWASPE
jgi:hypothetical protein